MFSRNFGGIACAATIASRFTGSPSPAASSITARTAYSAFAVTRIAALSEPTASRRTGSGCTASASGASEIERAPRIAAATLPRCLVFPSNPIKKGEKDSTHDSLPLEASPRRGRERHDVRGRAAPRRRPAARRRRRSPARSRSASPRAAASDDSTATAAAARSTWSRYSTPEEAYTGRPRARRSTQTPDGEGVEFSNSFGASGDQSRAVEAGQPADVVHFALEPDMTRLVDAGLVADDWNQNQYKGIVEDSVVVFVVRKGNPDNIQTWDDLIQRRRRGPDAEPVHLRRRPLEPDGRLRQPGADRGQVRGGGPAVHLRPARQRAGPGRERPRRAGDVPRRQGRRPARLRERGDRRLRTPARTSTTSSPTARS